MQLSVAMIMKNEEKNLVRTLEPIKKLSELIDLEIIIVDSGSTDKSVEIAKQYTNKVFHEEWKNDFSYMRNISINKCIGDYILILDADEEIINVEYFADFINEDKLYKYNSGLINIINFSNNKEKSLKIRQEAKLQRLFRNGKVKYKGRIHEQPIECGEVKVTGIDILHYGYQNSDYELMEYKFERNVKLLKADIKNEPNNIYTNFQIATSYQMHKDYDEALYYIEIAYGLIGGNYKDNIYVLDKYCSILHNKEDYIKIKEIAKLAINYEKEFADFYFYLALAYYEENDYENSIENFWKVIKYKDFDISTKNSTLSSNVKGLINKFYVIIIDCYRQTKRFEEGYKLILGIDDSKVIKSNIGLIIDFILNYDVNKLNYIEKYIEKDNYEIILNLVYNNKYKEKIKTIDINKLSGKLKDLITIINTRDINNDLITIMKNIMIENEIAYTYYLEIIINSDDLDLSFIKYIKDKKLIEKLSFIYSRKYKSIENSISYINNLKDNYFSDINLKISILKGLILSNNLNNEKHIWAFNELISLEYYLLINKYNSKFIKENLDLINEEDRFFFEIKEALSYKYESKLEFVRKLKKTIHNYKDYSQSVRLLLEGNYEIKDNLKELLEQVKNNIYILINNKNYQEAYNVCEEITGIINFDFEISSILYSLLNNFEYYKEANIILKNIILYGKVDEVNEILFQINN